MFTNTIAEQNRFGLAKVPCWEKNFGSHEIISGDLSWLTILWIRDEKVNLISESGRVGDHKDVDEWNNRDLSQEDSYKSRDEGTNKPNNFSHFMLFLNSLNTFFKLHKFWPSC